MFLKWLFVLCIYLLSSCFGWVPVISPHNSKFYRWKCSFRSTNDTADTVPCVKRTLICGDGDLSFSAHQSNVFMEVVRDSSPSRHTVQNKLIATVLEDRDTHRSIYQGSDANEQVILANGHEVVFGVDATNLQYHFPNTYFDRIQFNFPHWKGKSNHRYNRQLIQDFLQSASEMLNPDGKIHIALVEGQGGYRSKTLEEYRDTWMPSMYAAENGLLLYHIEPFHVHYNLSSHRGVDRGFSIGKHPQLYIFGKPSDTPIDKQYQQCCRHELHIMLPTTEGDSLTELEKSTRRESKYTSKDFVHGDAVQQILQDIVPRGIVVKVMTRSIIPKETSGYANDMVVYLIVYCGEKCPLTRTEADRIRSMAEVEIEKYVELRENRRGRLVSKPFPYFLLESITSSNAHATIPIES